ncbi:MAG: hypothetical protein HY815_25730 [Candidatus Riflebacteria bacterium]|nr:hypothetical protein [Candidatus Riflebacteria bacterium]
MEKQIELYQQGDRERCLSFQMRSNLASLTDDQGLARLRFVFAGYRVAHASEGAWANWGDVLRLDPLQSEEAVSLIAGPLARMGVDCLDQAPSIAHRCGYQPAVLLKFGAQLIRQLVDRRVGGFREQLQVTPEDVLATFESKVVQDDIRSIVKQNFQGNDAGWIIFSALLLEFSDLAPRAGLTDAASRVLDRLKHVDPDTGWLQTDEGSSLGKINAYLRDFVERRLLVERVERGASSHFLRFPHHLPILVQPDTEPESVIRHLIADLRSRQGQPGSSTIRRALLAPEQAQRMAGVVLKHRDKELPVRAAVMCTLWPEAIEHSSVGVADRIGMISEQVIPVDQLHVRKELLVGEAPLAILRVPAEQLETVLSQRPISRKPPLLTGGVDLLRELIRRDMQSDELFEWCSLGRLSVPQVDWWFRRVRCIEFECRGALDRIMKGTGGIPLLLRRMDLSITQAGEGVSLTEPQFERAYELFESQFADVRASLVSGESAVRLTTRELEILRWVCHASQASPDRTGLVKDLLEEFEVYQEELGLPPVTPSDGPSLQLLQAAGFLPVDPDGSPRLPFERIVPVPQSDAVHQIARCLQ